MERVVDTGALLTPSLDRETIGKALARLDDRLFLDPEMDVTGSYLFWTVKYHVAGDQPPVLILEWRDEPRAGDVGRPRELSYGLVEEIKRREGLGDGLVERVVAKNRERQARIDADKVANLEEVVGDVAPRMKSSRSAVLHRGQHLRRSRDKERARGKKV